MVQYRRNRQGRTFFFTATLRDRQSSSLIDHIGALREAWAETARVRPFETVAVCVLPDHLHTIWSLPEGDSDYPVRWRSLKSGFTRRLRTLGVAGMANRKGEYSIWQRRYWEHAIRDEGDLHAHVDYIHYNPVKHGHVDRVADWPHPSFHRYVREGVLPDDWGSAPLDAEGHRFGE